jgi:hypothetical protein
VQTWSLPGPDQAILSIRETAKYFHLSLSHFRGLVRRGLMPRPRGHGSHQYYTGLDVAIITEMYGRWAPEDVPEDPTEPEEPAPRKRP